MEEVHESISEEIEAGAQTTCNYYLNPGDIRAHFVVDEVCEELKPNGYADVLNFGAEGL